MVPRRLPRQIASSHWSQNTELTRSIKVSRLAHFNSEKDQAFQMAYLKPLLGRASADNHEKELYPSDRLAVRVRMSNFGLSRYQTSLHVLMVLFSLVPPLTGYTVYLTDLPNAVARITINLKLIAD